MHVLLPRKRVKNCELLGILAPFDLILGVDSSCPAPRGPCLCHLVLVGILHAVSVPKVPRSFIKRARPYSAAAGRYL